VQRGGEGAGDALRVKARVALRRASQGEDGVAGEPDGARIKLGVLASQGDQGSKAAGVKRACHRGELDRFGAGADDKHDDRGHRRSPNRG
jgi:hypothetical protein